MALLLAGTLSLGVGVVLDLHDRDDRSVAARDLGSVPGSSVALSTSRPLAEAIPILSGLSPVDPVPGGFEGAPPAVPPTDGLRGAGPSGAGLPGEALGAAAPSAASATPPAGATSVPSTEPEPALADPTATPVAPRPSPRPLPTPEPPLAPQEPGLVSPLYRIPDPPPSTVRTPVVPAQLDLPARSVTAPVDPVGTDPSGGMVVPEQVRTVGWWAPGVLPGGAAGSAVIAGHVDSRTQGVGVLAVLPQLAEGEPVLVRDAAGRTAGYRVAARREYGKYDLPRDVFRRDGGPQLVLITCGGRFDPVARSYESNIVVYAVPE